MRDISETFYSDGIRGLITLSDTSIRLNTNVGVLLNKDCTIGKYPKTLTHSIIGPAFAPTGRKTWDRIDEDSVIPSATQTIIDYRLSDGTTQRYWDGAAWSAATTDSHWNTLAVINVNIATYAQSTLRIVSRLRSIDGVDSPILKNHKLLWTLTDSQFSVLEDLLVEEIVPELEAITITGRELVLEAPNSPTNEFNMRHEDEGLSDDYVISNVSAVYDLKTDPNESTTILKSFSGDDVFLTVDIPFLTKLKIIFDYTVPVVAITTHVDFVEVTKIPSIVIENIVLAEAVQAEGYNFVSDEATGVSTGIRYPIEYDLEFDIVVIASKITDIFRLVEEVARRIQNNPVIHSAKLDRDYYWHFLSQFDLSDINRSGELRAQGLFPSVSATVRIPKIHILSGAEVSKFLVTVLKPTMISAI